MDKRFPPNPTDADRQADDARFLTREFDMTVTQASDLVARNGVPPADVKARIEEADGTPVLPDRLQGVPVPSAPPEEFTNDADEHARKPVLHRRNDSQGSG